MRQERCPVCGGAATMVHQAAEQMFGTGERFLYGECDACPLLWLIDVPDDLSAYYPAGYEAFALPGHNPVAAAVMSLRDRSILRAGERPDARRSPVGVVGAAIDRAMPNNRLRAVAGLGLQPDDVIIDVGAGQGAFVRCLRRNGFARARGIDRHTEQPDPTGHGDPLVQRRSLAELEPGAACVTFNHSFEHLVEFRAALADAVRALRPGGWCVLRVPTFPSQVWQRYGVAWVQLDAPRHVVLHSPGSITRLASEAGLAVERVYQDADALQFWGSERYRAGRTLAGGGPVERLRRFGPRHRRWERASRALNRDGRGDQTVFVLRRPARSSAPGASTSHGVRNLTSAGSL